VANERNHDYDTFLRDTLTGATELISAHHPLLPSQSPNGPSLISSTCVSSNGLYIAFASDADNLVPNDTNGCRDVFAFDVAAGTNILASVDTNGLPGAGMSSEPSLSADGRHVAFTSWASNLVANDNNTAQDVFVRDLQNGTNDLVTVNTSGTGSGNGASGALAISADGRYVLFRSKAQNLASAPYTAGTENLFLRDRQAGVTVALTTGGWVSWSMTLDGRFVAYVAVISPISSNLYVWNSQTASRVYTNSTSSLSTVAISPNGQFLAYLAGSGLDVADWMANSNWVVSAGTFPSHPGLRFSADGRFLTYATSAANMATDTNGNQDVYFYDFQSRSNFLVGGSFNSLGSLNGASDSPDISADGRFIAYRSFASNNVPADINSSPDLFVFDRLSGDTTLVSANQYGNSTANNWSLTPWFSGGGQTLVFQSTASDMISQDFNHSIDVFALDLIPTNAASPTNAAADLHAQVIFGGIPDLVTGTPVAGPVVTWPVEPGISYGLQFKNDLNDPAWQSFNGSLFLFGAKGYAIDLTPSTGKRFYRFILNN
jgi:Tol biopolymer transport system component